MEQDNDAEDSWSQHSMHEGLERVDDDDGIDYEDDDGVDWEDVPLDSFQFQIQTTKIKTKNEIKNAKREKSLQFKRKWLDESFALHLLEIPLCMEIFQNQYLSCVCDYKNHKLIKKKIIPKLIQKKFNEWNSLEKDSVVKEDKCRTLILGLCMWFRSNFKINGNGVRQTPYRLRNMVYNKEKLGKERDIDVQSYYGQKSLNSSDFRATVKLKKGNRDQLVFIFYIMLLNLLDLSEKDNKGVELRLVHSLPIHDYKRVQYLNSQNIDSIMKLDHKCPNLADSELFSPYYWIEYKTGNGSIYTIDPVVDLNRDNIVKRYKLDEYQDHFQQMCGISGLHIQSHYYVIGINNNFEVMDLSARYLKNIRYRYEPCLIDTSRNRDWRSYCTFKYFLKNTDHRFKWDYISEYDVNDNDDDADAEQIGNPWELQKLKKMSINNLEIPKTLYQLKIDPNFTSNIFLRKNLDFVKGEPYQDSSNHSTTMNIYLKKQLYRLRSQYHWLILGRTVEPGAEPLVSKKKNNKRKLYIDEDQREEYELTQLYTIEQTTATPRLPELSNVKLYRNQFGDVHIFNIKQITPLNYKVVSKNMILEGIEIDNIKLIRKYNKSNRRVEILEYVEVVSGFDFKKKPGFAVAVKKSILLAEKHFVLLSTLQQREVELVYLNKWYWTVKKLEIQKRIESGYTALSE